MYIIFTFLSGLVGLSMSVLMRMELMTPGVLLSENIYNVLITTHGLIMIFFVVMTLLIGGFGNLLIPVMVGSNDLAFYRVNGMSF